MHGSRYTNEILWLNEPLLSLEFVFILWRVSSSTLTHGFPLTMLFHSFTEVDLYDIAQRYKQKIVYFVLCHLLADILFSMSM